MDVAWTSSLYRVLECSLAVLCLVRTACLIVRPHTVTTPSSHHALCCTTAAYSVRTVLQSIQSLLADPNNDSPLNVQAAKLWDQDQTVYRQVLQGCRLKMGGLRRLCGRGLTGVNSPPLMQMVMKTYNTAKVI